MITGKSKISHCKMSPLSHSYPDMRENYSEPAESSRRNEGIGEILEMLISMKKEMEEREREEVGKTTTNQRRIHGS